MRIIISPAKKMNVVEGVLGWDNLPEFMEETAFILHKLQGMSYDELKKLWKCSDKIAEENVIRLENMDLRRGLTPAILAYEGIQYQHMSPVVFSQAALEYVTEHLRILSGFYGVLKPFDGVTPYRLEMQSKLKIADAKDLYGFWGGKLAEKIASETDCIINLASKEYSIAISKHLPEKCRFITCVFGEVVDGKVIEKGTLCKMARGEMVRLMAENNVQSPEEIKKLSLANYAYAQEYSDDSTFVFINK
jgi:cytoplasmic iron level regulating protein YaaA (DUF328/UPF0246 family)